MYSVATWWAGCWRIPRAVNWPSGSSARAAANKGSERDQLTVHADRGAAPASKTVAELLRDLGVACSHSRPRVSNDNPYSEAQFKTLKYGADYPDRFDSYADALSFCREFFESYNNHHRHSGIAYLTPACVHAGRVDEVTEVRRAALERAYATHPERFVNRPPSPPVLPREVWINNPADKSRVELDCPMPVVEEPGGPPTRLALVGITANRRPPEELSSLAGGDERSELGLYRDEAGGTPTETHRPPH